MGQTALLRGERRIGPGRRLGKVATVLLLSTGLAGCITVGEDYVTPDSDLTAAYSEPDGEGAQAGALNPAELATWWTVLDDPQLNSLVTRGLEGNLSLVSAAARLEEARARRGITRSAAFPTVTGDASILQTETSAAQGFEREETLYNAGFDAVWELDLFGGIARDIEAADADVAASAASLYDVRVSLIAEIALNYVEIRSLQQQIDIAETNEAAQARTRSLVEANYRAGEISRLDFEQATANLARTRSTIPALEAGLSEAKTRLAILLGEQPGALDAELAEDKPIPTTDDEIAVGIPADLLRRRPDIRSAEQSLAAQTARASAARADLYPSLSLIGSIGLEALSGDHLFDSDSRALTVGPSLSLPIFNAGRIRQSIAVEDARTVQALAAYEETVLRAVKDVEDALVDLDREYARHDQLIAAEASSAEVLRIAEEQYEGGEISFLAVLDAQRSLLDAQNQLAGSEAAITTNIIRLYKALGGGWSPSTVTDQQAQSIAPEEVTPS